MQLPHGTIVAVADGERLVVLRNGGDEARPHLAAQPAPALAAANGGSGGRHHSSAANPDESRLAEDGFAAATAGWLNEQVLAGKIADLVVVAPAKTLGELRKHYHKQLQAHLRGELAKDLANHPIPDIEAALAHA